jgi:hypothetical protein
MYNPTDLNSYDIDALDFFQDELDQLLTNPYIIINPIGLIKNKKAIVNVFVNVKKAILTTLVPYGTKFLPEAIDDIYAWEMFWYKVKVFLQVGLQLAAIIILIGVLNGGF